MISLVKISKSVYINNNFASHGIINTTNSYAQNISISQIYIFFSSNQIYEYNSIDKNRLRLSGEEERNDKIKEKNDDCTNIIETKINF